MLGRFEDAATAIDQAIFNLEAGAIANPQLLLQLAEAYRNLANLLTRQDQHQSALQNFGLVHDCLARYRETVADIPPEISEHIGYVVASTLSNEAVAFMFLDRPKEAEEKLHDAIKFFAQTDDWLNRGRAHSNLGSLYLRSGQYGAALAEFDQAMAELTESSDHSDSDGFERWRQADVTPLDRAMAYLALNLLPEATSALERCELFFRKADRPYELGQCLYTLGLVRLYSRATHDAKAALDEAQRLFKNLGNPYWLNRTSLALAILANENQEFTTARALTHTLLQEWQASDGEEGSVKWDTGSLVDLLLLRMRMHLDAGELAEARQYSAQVQAILGEPSTPENHLALPHLHLRFQHMWGQIEQVSGNHAKAEKHFRQALDLLESQRASLPIEEIRTAFLDDKSRLYDDLIITILGEGDVPQSCLTEVFNVIERARSRSLLERLYATLTEESEAQEERLEEDRQRTAQQRHLRQRLHWLYNRLLSNEGTALDDSMIENRTITEEIQADEAMLQQLEWQMSSKLLDQAQPVDLQLFQKTLSRDEQALAYYIANQEVFVLLIDAGQIQIFRHLCDVDTLVHYQNELRFQLGRAELGTDYLTRHAKRLQRALQNALYNLYQSLIAPLESELWATKLHIIPYGILHQIPFHALWDGNRYLIQRFECTYAPSASVAVYCHDRPFQFHDQLGLAGIALDDATIPAAQAEVQAVTRHFQKHWLYLNEQVNENTVREAAAQADILHIATHGLFRADNPFFSALKLADGWLDVREIYRLPLRAYLVVLSACESGASQVRGGDELIGLARGFLGAGARQLLVTLWNVNDQSAAKLMDRFYTHLVDDETPQETAAALRTVQLEAIAADQHPYFWAPFFMIGK